jgi:hypothetical protein
VNRSGSAGTVVLTFILVVLAAVPTLAQETATEPPEPSYADQWSQSSPFLDLRNQPSIESPEAPSNPQAPEVDTITFDGETVAISGPDFSADTAASDDTGVQTRKKTSNGDTATEPDTDLAMNLARDTKPTEPAAVSNNTDTDEPTAVTESGTSPKTRKTKATGRQYSIFDGETLFADLSPVAPPVDTGLDPLRDNLGNDTVSLGAIRSDQNLQDSPDFPHESGTSFGGFFWWGIGGVVVMLIIGMFFWFREPRIEVVNRDYSSAEDFFKEQLQNRREDSETVADAVANAEKQDRVRTDEVLEGAGPASRDSINYEHLLEQLRETGFNRDYESILKLYYREGLSQQDIADQTSRGVGEVGLVLDYVERLRKG